MDAYRYLIKMRILVGFTYRFEVVMVILTRLIVMVASVCLWNSAYANTTELEGLTHSQMITYAVLAIVLSSLFQTNVENGIGTGINRGTIAVQFLRPMDVLSLYFCEDIGLMVTSFLLRCVPLLLCGMLIFGLSAPVSVGALLLFMISIVFSYLIIWLLSAITAMITFWAMFLGQMGAVRIVVVNILSGMLIPVWFFPQVLQDILRFLPFQYTYQTPLGIYIGRIGLRDGLFQIGIQCVWIVLLFGVLHIIWKRAQRHVLVQGG
ncbi:MAG TPA: ABC-2 family transporter protein [Candidatus Limiplasma sp.]|nr:ABC-2 family transporter protein [Candidatus Limiplasma sp.]